MARVCPKNKVVPESCWCSAHKSKDADENEHRRIVGMAKFVWKGGEALHVFVTSKQGGEVSLCNLRHAVSPDEMKEIRRKGTPREPVELCVQCRRTLASRVPNARMRRYLVQHR